MLDAYYNENHPFAARWLETLVEQNLVAQGDVDARSIVEVRPVDLELATQAHFFAGIGGWSLALRLAGWPDDLPVWTGSCPCQPFSQAGGKRGLKDERHLWPVLFDLIRDLHPPVFFGEQVSSPDGLAWFDVVSSDLEGEGYSVGALDTCAASVGAPHKRQRLYFVAVSHRDGREVLQAARLHDQGQPGDDFVRCGVGGVADTNGLVGGALGGRGPHGRPTIDPVRRGARSVGDADGGGAGEPAGAVRGHEGQHEVGGADGDHAPVSSGAAGCWTECDWIPSRDPGGLVYRPVEPGSFPLVDGLPRILGRLRAIEQEGHEALRRAAGEGDTNEVLRVVRGRLCEIASRQERPAGVHLELSQAEVLLAFLFCIESARFGSHDSSSVKEARDAAQLRIVRGLRHISGNTCSPCGRGPDEQLIGEPADALQQLSFVLARLAATYGRAAEQAHATAERVGRLRAYGNAIVPELAATFIRAACATTGD